MRFDLLTHGLTPRIVVALLLFLAALVSVPFWATSYVLTIFTLVLYLSLLGQSWNLMLGYAGLLSLGHAMFIGIGSYTAGYLFVAYGVPPVIGIFPAIALAILVAMFIGFLGFRFSITGVYFALLTIAFAELIRILVDHAGFLGATEGMFLPVSSEDRDGFNLITLRGHPVMFYYLALGLSAAALVLCRRLLNSKLGYYWQAIRDDQDAAQALGVNLFRYKMYAVMLSAGMAGTGGVFYAFYQNSLFPESTFLIERSIELTLGPIVGGVGTLFGPIVGAFLLTPLGEFITLLIDWMQSSGIIDPGLKLYGLKQFVWGLVVALIVLFKPTGLWPWIRDALGLKSEDNK
ncbi:MAG: branched-chain amino acid ABC transporter permease [Fimbriimonadaceae bacterium]|nr:branched-chain amino acid ABC transporter permease [Alphaproteobacteria bacterium]